MDFDSLELVFLVLQFLEDEGYNEAVHKLETELRMYFNVKRFQGFVLDGEWEEAEKYLSGFTNIDANRFSTEMFFDIRKLKYYEALDRRDLGKASSILVEDLLFFSMYEKDLVKELAQLLTLENWREHVDVNTEIGCVMEQFKMKIERNPDLKNKLEFPFSNGRLKTLINQSLNWQHHLCNEKRQNPQSLYNDHSCPYIAMSIPGFLQLSPYGPFQQAPAPIPPPFPGWMTNPSKAAQTVSGSNIELPRNVAVVLNQSNLVMSMDFHPSQPTVLLVGTNLGDIAVWDVSSSRRLAYRNFEVWNIQAYPMLLQSAQAKEDVIAVNRVVWNPDGTQFGVAYSKNLVHIYKVGQEDLIHHLEINAHVGGVNDIAFTQPKKNLCVVTCGDDKKIKVWDVFKAVLQFTFEGHETAVHSICPHSRGSTPFLLSTSLDGKIKLWFYDYYAASVDFTAPGYACTTMAYSTDGTRAFSCGTNKEGNSYFVEWNENDGSAIRTYIGLQKSSAEVIQFDTTQNRFLAAGNDCMIKFWDMDNTDVLTTADADGGLLASPRIRFNKLGSLLAVSATNCIKVLANADGFQMLRSLENRFNSAPKSVSETSAKDMIQTSAMSPLDSSNPMTAASVAVSDQSAPEPSINSDSRSLVGVTGLEELDETSNIWKLAEISEPSQCRCLKLPDNLLAVKVPRLAYTNSGTAILALASNAVHKLWKWQKTDGRTGKATTVVLPQLYLPSNNKLMINEINDMNPEEAVHCFAISKNDSYIVSASGGEISFFNLMTFKSRVVSIRPSATFLAFHPQDSNIIAIGMDDSSLQIYNVCLDEVTSKLRGHRKRITGLAFSSVLNVLVSSGEDAQLCVWGTDGWDKKTSKFLQIPDELVWNSLEETCVQFHHDQVTFLVVHGTQLAIYEAAKLECLKQWIPTEGSIITHGTFSCDCKMVYTCFKDGNVCIFTSALQLRCRISPNAYNFNSQPRSSVYPIVVASNPTEPNQFTVGLMGGSVIVLEPLESENRWGMEPPFST